MPCVRRGGPVTCKPPHKLPATTAALRLLGLQRALDGHRPLLAPSSLTD